MAHHFFFPFRAILVPLGPQERMVLLGLGASQEREASPALL